MEYDTTNLRLSVIERLRTNSRKNPALDRDIDIAMGFMRRCNDGLRHRDNYVMPLHREDFVLPHRWTWSADVAMSIVPVPYRDSLMMRIVPWWADRGRDLWAALPSAIMYHALVAVRNGEMVLDWPR